jgi:hypothetical protein
MTWVAMGPATSAPKQLWQRSTVAATAICGRSEGDEPGLVDSVRRIADLGRAGLSGERDPADRQTGRLVASFAEHRRPGSVGVTTPTSTS